MYLRKKGEKGGEDRKPWTSTVYKQDKERRNWRRSKSTEIWESYWSWTLKRKWGKGD